MNVFKPTPDSAYLDECFKYVKSTGSLTWKCRPRSHFSSDRGWNIFNSMYSGTEAGTDNGKGYLVVKLDGSSYLVARLIWKMVTGLDASDEVDHKNTIRSDNRLVNLRLATRVQQNRNRGLRIDNTSGVKGVQLHKSGKWEARVSSKYLGLFDSVEEAVKVVDATRARAHREFSNSGVNTKRGAV